MVSRLPGNTTACAVPAKVQIQGHVNSVLSVAKPERKSRSTLFLQEAGAQLPAQVRSPKMAVLQGFVRLLVMARLPAVIPCALWLLLLLLVCSSSSLLVLCLGVAAVCCVSFALFCRRARRSPSRSDIRAMGFSFASVCRPMFAWSQRTWLIRPSPRWCRYGRNDVRRCRVLGGDTLHTTGHGVKAGYSRRLGRESCVISVRGMSGGTAPACRKRSASWNGLWISWRSVCEAMTLIARAHGFAWCLREACNRAAEEGLNAAVGRILARLLACCVGVHAQHFPFHSWSRGAARGRVVGFPHGERTCSEPRSS